MKQLILMLLLCAQAWAATGLTTVAQAIKNPDGSAFVGTVTITLNATCSQPDATLVYAGTKIVRVTTGAFSAALYPNSTCTPAGTSYSVRYMSQAGGTVKQEYWVVTAATPTTIDAVRTAFIPTPALSVALSQLAIGGATVGQLMRYSGSAWAPWTATYIVNPFTALGDTLYGGAAGAPTRLAGNTTTTRKFLRQVGNGTVSAAPAWDTLLAADSWFTQAGTGAVPVTVDEVLKRTLSVKDFGAVGDGTTDDSAAFQLAITAALASGGEVYCPSATYLLNTGFVIPSTLRVNCPATLLLGTNNQILFDFNSATNISNSRVFIDKVQGTGKANGQEVFRLRNASNSTFEVQFATDVTYVVHLLQRDSAGTTAIAENRFFFQLWQNATKAVYYEAPMAVNAEGNQFFGGFIAVCDNGVTIDTGIAMSGGIHFQGAIDNAAVASSTDWVNNTSNATLGSILIFRYIRVGATSTYSPLDVRVAPSHGYQTGQLEILSLPGYQKKQILVRDGSGSGQQKAGVTYGIDDTEQWAWYVDNSDSNAFKGDNVTPANKFRFDQDGMFKIFGGAASAGYEFQADNNSTTGRKAGYGYSIDNTPLYSTYVDNADSNSWNLSNAAGANILRAVVGGVSTPGTMTTGAGGTLPWNLTGYTDDAVPGEPGTANTFWMLIDRTTGLPSWRINGGTQKYVALGTSTGGVAQAQLPNSTRTFTVLIPGSGTAGAVQDADDFTHVWKNAYGASLTITAIGCIATGSGTTRVQLTNDSAAILTDNTNAGLDVTSTEAAGTLHSTNKVIANGKWVGWTTVSAGTGNTDVACSITGTVPII